MQIPLEIAFRNVRKTRALEALIEKETAKLEKIHHHISRCRLVVERPHRLRNSGNPYRIRIDIRAPAGNEIVISSEPSNGHIDESLYTLLRRTFDSAQRQLKKMAAQERGR